MKLLIQHHLLLKILEDKRYIVFKRAVALTNRNLYAIAQFLYLKFKFIAYSFFLYYRKNINKVLENQQNTEDIEGYYYTAKDGSQMAFWTCFTDRISKEHIHDYDEYMVCLSGEH
ncbi:putative membrane protein [Clostridium bornimense]|uniref:Putative membrane protein n=1 Tax=Clostridium bornimense TaxID=1216932 RepID=W6S671_9CLOT|nr:putative membrane protein [Clostridium bornimense]